MASTEARSTPKSGGVWGWAGEEGACFGRRKNKTGRAVVANHGFASSKGLNAQLVATLRAELVHRVVVRDVAEPWFPPRSLRLPKTHFFRRRLP
jgi:hypothetical protein